jgi:DNA-binding NarL/FixJ family response regulator
MAAERLRVLIADDHPVFRRGLRATIEADERFTIVGEAATGDEVLELALQATWS